MATTHASTPSKRAAGVGALAASLNASHDSCSRDAECELGSAGAGGDGGAASWCAPPASDNRQPRPQLHASHQQRAVQLQSGRWVQQLHAWTQCQRYERVTQAQTRAKRHVDTYRPQPQRGQSSSRRRKGASVRFRRRRTHGDKKRATTKKRQANDCVWLRATAAALLHVVFCCE